MKQASLFMLCLLFFCTGNTQTVDQKQIKVHYFNVGQAASALVEFPCGAVLIDAGAQDAKYRDTLINDLKMFFARRTDLNRWYTELNTVTFLTPKHTCASPGSSACRPCERFHR